MKLLGLLFLAAFIAYSLDAKRIRMKIRSRHRDPKKAAHAMKKNNTIGPMSDIYGAELVAIDHGLIYTTDISLGDPFKVFTVIIDTGSAELYVPHVGYKNGGPTMLNKPDQVYDETKSKTAVKSAGTLAIDYASGKTRGVYFEDQFAFGTYGCRTNFMPFAKHVKFGAADTTTFGDIGILGIGFEKTQGTNIFAQAVDEKLLDEPVFTAFFKKCPAGTVTCNNVGTITLGGHDTKLCGDVIDWVPITPGSIHWEFTLELMEVKGFRYKVKTQVISDTGASNWLMGKTARDGLIRAMGGQLLSRNMYAVPCDKGHDIKLTIAGKVYTVPFDAVTVSAGNNWCQLNIAEIPDNGQWNLGIAWIRSFCNVHDFKNKKIGFALPK